MIMLSNQIMLSQLYYLIIYKCCDRADRGGRLDHV